jgi:putative hemolysin
MGEPGGVADCVVHLLGLEPTSEHSGVHSVDELEYLVHATREAGLLEEEQELMVAGVFDFREHRVSQVMTPRTELDAVAVATPWPEVVRRVATSRHQRLPIYADDLDHILGVVYAKSAARCRTARIFSLSSHLSVRCWMHGNGRALEERIYGRARTR